MIRIMATQFERESGGEQACAKGMRWFKQRWPRGIPLTPDNIAEVVRDANRGLVKSPILWAIERCGVFGWSGIDDWWRVRDIIQDLGNRTHNEEGGEAAIALVLALEDWEYADDA